MAIIGNNNEQGAYPVILFQESQTWSCPVAMEVIIYVIGAGGSGASVGGNSDSTHNARGGAAGGCAVSRLSLAAQDYTITIGSGGEKRSSNGVATGNDGGASSFANDGGVSISTITANGGAGGTQSTSAQNVTTGGGTGSNGNLMNNTGGGGGGNTSTDSRVSGGGAVNLYGSDCNGGGEGSGFCRGGIPHGSSKAKGTDSPHYGSQAAGTSNDPQNETLAVNYFPSLMVHQSGGSSWSETISSIGYNIDGRGEMVLAGSRQGQTAYTYNYTNALYGVAAPFCGGHGYRASTGNSSNIGTVACAGGVGAGGGACMGNNCTAYSGAGGSGLIMIFPIQLG